MININKIEDKKAVKLGEQIKKVLFQFSANEVKKVKQKKRIPLNISLVIDVSGSMNETVGGNHLADNNINWNNVLDGRIRPYNERHFNPMPRSRKLDYVISAGQSCVDMLNPGDFISIVLFSSTVTVLQQAVEVTNTNKVMIQKMIGNIKAGGGTDLHQGWVEGGIQVAKNLNSKYLNRVLLLTDGEITSGVNNIGVISNNVSGLSEKGIATTTFGVGDYYNDDLLTNMAQSSGGNFYYIENPNQTVEFFSNEFNELSNIVATGLTARIESNLEGLKIDCLNQVSLKESGFLLGSVLKGKTVSFLFELSFNVNAELGSKVDLGSMIFEYKDSEGVMQKMSVSLTYSVVDESAFDTMEVEQEIVTQDTLMFLAKQQLKASEFIKGGNRNLANNILRDSVTMALNSTDERVIAQAQKLDQTLSVAESYSDDKMTKYMSSMSYNIRNHK